MIERDVTDLAAAIRRLDVAAVVRSFLAPGLLVGVLGGSVLAGAVGVLHGEPLSIAGIVLVPVYLAISAAVSLLVMVLADAMARQPWRDVSTGLALAAGLVLTLLRVVLASAIVYGALSFALRAEFREQAGYVLEDIGAALTGDGYLLGQYAGYAIALVLYVVLLPLGLLWYMRVETQLAGPSPRAELLGDVSGGGLVTRMGFAFGLPSSMWGRKALKSPAMWMLIGARGMVYASFLVLSLAVGLSGIALAVDLGIALALLVGGHWLFAAGKRAAARRMWAPERGGDAPPILFLRSFENDQFRFQRKPWDLAGRWLDLWSFRRNADEMLIDEFAWYGPVIALGRPGETRTPFGADRRYVSHEDWQQIVRDAAERASAIVVAAGDTKGLLWEYTLLKEQGYAAKTIFLFPSPRMKGAEMARNIYREVFGSMPGETRGRPIVAISGAGAAAEVVHASRPRATAYLAALRRFLQMREAGAGRPVGDAPVHIHGLLLVLTGVAAGLLAGVLLAFFMSSL
jgi:hypothetical protein